MPITVMAASAKARPSQLPLTTALPLAAILLVTALLYGLRYVDNPPHPTDSAVAFYSDARDITETEYPQDTQEQNRQFHQILTDRTRSRVRSVSHPVKEVSPP